LVADALRRRGALVLSADGIVRELTTPGSAIVRQIGAELGERFVGPDGGLDRGALAETIFRDAEARRRLEAILHPHVIARIQGEIHLARNLHAPPRVLAVEVPLLYEVGMEACFDEVVVVAAPEEAQVERLMRRDGLDQEAARLRVASQMPLQDKIARANRVIWNTGSAVAVEDEVGAILDEVP
jgi:dephospho-CoA kinase